MNDQERYIRSAEYGHIRRGLQQPYVLSFAEIETINSCWVHVEDDRGGHGIGEAVPLPGYGSESIGDIESCIRELCSEIINVTVAEAYDHCIRVAKERPFAASAVVTAIDLISWELSLNDIQPINLVFPISASSDKRMLDETVKRGLEQGYHHFKMKIGRDIRLDMLSAKFILSNFRDESLTVRFDANQAYEYQEALSFSRMVEDLQSTQALWLEQPLDKEDWIGTEALCTHTSIPIMLDESIYNRADVIRAKEVGCQLIKLKLFKHPGMNACRDLAKEAADLGLGIVIGNGVSTDIGNLAEALVWSALPGVFRDGAECNGFARLDQAAAFPGLVINGSGQLIWTGPARLDIASTADKLRKESPE